MKYRIVSNEEVYKIQKKGFFFWNHYHVFYANRGRVYEFKFLKEAEEGLKKLNKEYEEHKIVEEIKKRKWKTVDTPPNSINFIKEK